MTLVVSLVYECTQRVCCVVWSRVLSAHWYEQMCTYVPFSQSVCARVKCFMCVILCVVVCVCFYLHTYVY